MLQCKNALQSIRSTFHPSCLELMDAIGDIIYRRDSLHNVISQSIPICKLKIEQAAGQSKLRELSYGYC